MMDRRTIDEYVARLRSEISPALGCTEPAAVALAVAYAAQSLAAPAEEVRVAVSQYIFKNGMNVGIPGTDMIGLEIAVALGAVSAAPQKGLMVLNGLSEEQKLKARELVAEQRVKISLSNTGEKVYIEAVLCGQGHTARAVIAKQHSNLVLLEKDGEILVRRDWAEPDPDSGEPQEQEDYQVTVAKILDFANQVPLEEITFLREAIRLNRQIAQEGLTHDYGLKVGKCILSNSGGGLLSNDVGSYAVACAAAAADARMAGCDKPVMSAAGSGNQGLTASVPVVAISEKLYLPEEKTLRALALSILVTIHAKHHIGRLSVLCGCSIAAAIGTCCGVIYLLDGNYDNMVYGINTMVADISGVVCDGAKPGCALKIATAVSSAIRAATMALNGLGAGSHDGIVTADVEETLRNLGTLGNEGMSGTNSAILNMMLHK